MRKPIRPVGVVYWVAQSSLVAALLIVGLVFREWTVVVLAALALVVCGSLLVARLREIRRSG